MDDADRDDAKLQQAEKIIVTPGLPIHHKLYTQYANKILSELNFVWPLLQEIGMLQNCTMIGITGTKGKSTTTWITYNLLKWLWLKEHVWITGNFGTPLSQTIHTILTEGKKEDRHILVIESSSFMLHGLQDFSFAYSIWTNMSPDHLDWHPHYDHYVQSKAEIVDHTSIYGVVGKTAAEHMHTLPPQIELYNTAYSLEVTQFLGEHNGYNMGMAVAVVMRLLHDLWYEKSHQQIQAALATIPPLEHRLQLLKTVDGIKIYDDNMSTNSAAQKVAITSFSDPIVLLAGGSSKGEDFSILIPEYQKHVAHGILYGATASHFAEIFARAGIAYTLVSSLEDAMQHAMVVAKKENIQTILFSPGCASFDMFKNYYERAEKFVSVVEGL